MLAEFLQGALVQEDLQQRPLNCENCLKNRLCQVHGQQCEKLELKYNVNNVQNLFCTNLAQEFKGIDESGGETTCLSPDVIGCLLFHHSQQLSCNVHAITGIVSTSDSARHSTKEQVVTREQKRIATALYPTASLLNHACDPDVIVR